MKFRKNIVILLFILFPVTIISTLYFSGVQLNRNSLIKKYRQLSSKEAKLFIKKYFLPYREIDILRKNKYKSDITMENFQALLESMASISLENDLRIKRQLSNLQFQKSKSIEKLGDYGKFSNLGLSLKKYKPINDFLLRGINNPIPSSAYLDQHNKNIFLLSPTGVLAYAKKNDDKLDFKQIKNNINDYINEKQFKKTSLSHDELVDRLAFSTKDLLIHENKVFISFTNEESEDCWNTSIIYADINYEEMNFRPLFKPRECVHSKNNIDKVFLALQSGGRIIGLDENNVVLSTGEYRSRYLAQDKKSIMGKILKININDGNHNILSMGSRNIQGLFYDKLNNYFIFTEHGPKGGDEINLLLNKEYIGDQIPNYGWPISSYGEHYSSKANTVKYPLYKSHKKYGYIEPLKYFPPGIGISEIIGIDLKKKIYAVSSLNDHGLYIISLNKNNNINKLDRVSVNERIRDLMIYENDLYLFLEDSGSIGIINLDNLKQNNN